MGANWGGQIFGYFFLLKGGFLGQEAVLKKRGGNFF